MFILLALLWYPCILTIDSNSNSNANANANANGSINVDTNVKSKFNRATKKVSPNLVRSYFLKTRLNYKSASLRQNKKDDSRYDPKKDRRNVAFHKARKMAMDEFYSFHTKYLVTKQSVI